MAGRGLTRQFWFTLALVGLFLLFLPSVVLLVVSLLGKENSLNGWLQERFSISYHLFLTWWATVILLLLPALLVLLYFLKLKRRPMQVPSTFLWKKSIEDLHVNSLFQWLRENILLLLQVLTLLTLIYSLMAWQLHGRIAVSKHYILLIDNSASMAATDMAGSRLEAAKRAALAEIDGHTDSDFGMVIVFNNSAEILRSYTNDRGQLRLAVQSIAQSQKQTNIEEALRLADSLANPNRSADADAKLGEAMSEGVPTTLHLFSDGRFPDVPEFNKGKLTFEYHAQGKTGPSANNLALVELNAVRDEKDGSKLQVFARIRNYRTDPAQVKVKLDVRVGDRVVGTYEEAVQLDAKQTAKPDAEVDSDERKTVSFEVTEVSEQVNAVLHCRLQHKGDDLPLDDEAWLVVGVVRKARVLLVEQGNPVLHAFFDLPATLKLANVTYITPNDLKDDTKYGLPARNGEYDLIIFDQQGPTTADEMPLANTWFINCVPPPWKKAELPKLNAPAIKMNRHPLLRNLSTLEEIAVGECFRFDMKQENVPARSPRLLETEGDVALLFLLGRQSFSDLVMTFPFHTASGAPATNWFAQLGFPTFLRNVLYTLGNVGDGISEETLKPGQVKSIRPDVAVKEVKVRTPGVGGKDDALTRNSSRSDFVFGSTERVGIYDVSWNGSVQRSFAVSLLDENESRLEVRETLKLGPEELASGATRRHPRDLWKWVAFGAFLLLVLEWYIYNRRVSI